MIQRLKRTLAVLGIDQTITPNKLASDEAEIIKTLRITPHGVTKISSFEAQMGRNPNDPLSNVDTNSSSNNLNWESAKHACLDKKNLTKPPLPAEIMHDLQRWSEDEVCIKRRDSKPKSPILPKNLENASKLTQQATGAKS